MPPPPFDTETCENICQDSGGVLTCTPETVCESGVQYSVVQFESGSISAFGTCQIKGVSRNFCCNTPSPITQVEALGTEWVDKVGFSYPVGVFPVSSNLYPNSSTLTAQMSTGDSNDTLQGSDYDKASYSETLRGEDGMDSIQGLGGADILYGGLEGDYLNGGSGADRIYGDRGDDTINGGPGGDTIYGKRGIDTIRGGDDNDIIYGNNKGDFLFGDAGDDKLYGGNGADELDGGDDEDDLIGGNADDILVGGDALDKLHGGAGDDTLDGGDGPDTLYGSVGNDTLDGGPGDDVLCERDGYFIGSASEQCDAWNVFIGGDDIVEDVAFTDRPVDWPQAQIENCPNTSFLGNQSVETAGMVTPNRNWSPVLVQGYPATNFTEPLECQSIRAAYGE